MGPRTEWRHLEFVGFLTCRLQVALDLVKWKSMHMTKDADYAPVGCGKEAYRQRSLSLLCSSLSDIQKELLADVIVSAAEHGTGDEGTGGQEFWVSDTQRVLNRLASEASGY